MPPTRGGNKYQGQKQFIYKKFQYMPPTRGGNEVLARVRDRVNAFQYMPPTRGGNMAGGGRYTPDFVSIHAPHAGGQPSYSVNIPICYKFQYMPPTRGGNPVKITS